MQLVTNNSQVNRDVLQKHLEKLQSAQNVKLTAAHLKSSAELEVKAMGTGESSNAWI
jgi:hypothetical protein